MARLPRPLYRPPRLFRPDPLVHPARHHARRGQEAPGVRRGTLGTARRPARHLHQVGSAEVDDGAARAVAQPWPVRPRRSALQALSDEDLQERILGFVDAWAPIFGWDRFNIHIAFNEREHQAAAFGLPEYEHVTCYFNLARLRAELPDVVALEETVVHEMAHGYVWQLARMAGDSHEQRFVSYIEENTTSRIAYALMRARAAGGK